jgi:predicted nucleic acid-binding protein
MKVIYLESSALLHWLLGQPGAADVRGKIDRAEVVVTSQLTVAEAERALLHAENRNALKEGDGKRLRGLLNKAQASWTRMAVSDEVLARASRPFPVEPVRTLDAIHLATALEFTAVFQELVILSFDKRIRDNAEALGIS